MIHCFHHNDLDGFSAAAIVNLNFLTKDRRFYEMDYNMEFPFHKIDPGDEVIIVDYSIKPDNMHKLLGITNKVVWIDHHGTAIDDHKNQYYYATLDGRRDITKSGCLLTYEYYWDNKLTNAIKWINDRDLWKWELPFTASFCEGLTAKDHGPEDAIWRTLLGNNKEVSNELEIELINLGDVCIDYRTKLCAQYKKSYGFEVDFDGKSCYALNLYRYGSLVFGDKMDKYEMCISFVRADEKWIVGLYSKKIDVGEIARKYGGGGHRGAAGLVCDKLPF